MSEIGENTDFYNLLDLIEMDIEPEANYDKSGGNNNGIQEIQESINYTPRYCVQFNIYGAKEYDCGFESEDLQSLKGISGKVKTTQTVSGSFCYYSAVEKNINSLVTYPFCHNFCLKNTKFPPKLLRFQI